MGKEQHTTEQEYRLASRAGHPADTVVEIGAGKDRVRIGGGHFGLIAGPCSVESEEQIVRIAKAVKAAGATLLRGGAFKPRTSPYDFQGLGTDALYMLVKAREATGLPIVTELMSEKELPLFLDLVDVIQIGSRNMQNYALLKAVSRVHKPVLLKRGYSSTVKEWLLSAEYLLSGGNDQVILCERGVRGFDSSTRNVLDLAAIPLVKELSHLPVIVDPSHGTGRASLVAPMSLAAAASGADGLMIEVHVDPACSVSDAAQTITPDCLADITTHIKALKNTL